MKNTSHKTKRRCLDGNENRVNVLHIHSEDDKKPEEKTHSSDDPPMPSTFVTQVLHDNDHEEHINLKNEEWKLVERLSATPDSAMYGDDDGDLSGIRRDHLELVENVSSISDPVGPALPRCGIICIQGYNVKQEIAPILVSIFKKHGDIAADCFFKTSSVRTSFLELICEVIKRIESSDVSTIISDMEEIERQVLEAQQANINVSWLQTHLETIRKRNESLKTSLVGCLSELSQRPLGDDIRQLPLSVQTVVFSDNLLTEILLRLPVISLVLFKSISKRWLSLIKDTNFIKRRGQIPNVDPPCGVYFQRLLMKSDDFVPFDIRIPFSVCGTAAISLKIGNNAALVTQSCNGLLLCYVELNKCINSYVYNPSIDSSKLLPEPHISELKPTKVIFDMKMAFDPTKSPHYKLVHVESIGEDDDDDAMSVQVQTFTSQTGVWSVVCDDTFPKQCFSGFKDGLYWNDAIHWLTKFYYGALHYKLDFLNKHPTVTNIRLPVTLDEEMPWNRKLFESRGCLLLLGMDYTYSHQLNVYEMRNGSSEWLFKYFVNLDDIMRPFPEKWRIRSNIWCIALGESEENSFMVIGFNHKSVLYKILSKTFRELPGSKLLWDANYADSFLFTASFASV